MVPAATLIASTFLLNALGNFFVGLLFARLLGPEGFGIFALAVSLAFFLNFAIFEWVRHVIIRFHVPAAGRSLGARRLTAMMAASVAALIVLAVALGLAGVTFGLPLLPFVACIVVAVAFAFFEQRQALKRAAADARGYLNATLLRYGALAGVLVAVASYPSPILALTGVAFAALIGAAWPDRRGLADDRTDLAPAANSAPGFRLMLAYSGPMVISAASYALITALARSGIAQPFGAAEAGRFALAADVGFKVLGTAATVVELMSLTRTLAVAETQGRSAAHQRIARTSLAGIAVITPIAAGYVVALPSFTALIIPPDFQASFGVYTLLLLPSFFAVALSHVCANATLAVEARTVSSAAGAVAALSTCFIGFVLAQTPEQIALAVSCGFVFGFSVTLAVAWRIRETRPRFRDVVVIIAAALIMTGALWPFRTVGSPILNLMLIVPAGVLIYAAILFAFDVAGARTYALTRRWPFR